MKMCRATAISHSAVGSAERILKDECTREQNDNGKSTQPRSGDRADK